MNTKQRILDEALTLFAKKGYSNVYVGDIAQAVGIKAPSLYKHYKNKRAIFDAIIEEMDKRFLVQAGLLNIAGNDAGSDAVRYNSISEDELVNIGIGLFRYYLHDDYTKKFRKMLTIEQFHDNKLSQTYMELYYDEPMRYEGMLFEYLVQSGLLKTDNVKIMTLHFYSPIYTLLTVCDRDPSREEESVKILEEHIRKFDELYGRK